MAIRKIFINNSGSTRQILNRDISNGGSYEPSFSKWLEASDNSQLISDINNGLVIVNNGTTNLTIPKALEHVGKFQTVEASEVTFNNTTNGYIAIQAQAAIEESYTSAIQKPRFSIVTTFNGTVGNNDWLGYSELIAGDQVPIMIPYNCKLKEISVRYKNSNLLGIPIGSQLISGQLKIYKNGLTSPGNVVHTETFTNLANGKIINNMNISLLTNDFILGRWVDQGSNPSDMVIVYFFQVV